MNAGPLHSSNAKIVAVEELYDDDAENLVITEIGRHLDLRQTAQKIAKHRLGPLPARCEREEIEETVLQLRVAFKRDRIRRGQQFVLRDQSRDRRHSAAIAQTVADGD